MPGLLAIETSTDACSVALSVDQHYFEQHKIVRHEHGKWILPMIDALLSQAGLTLSKLDAISFSCGPGRFTALRIGASISQGLAFAANLPVIPVSSLQVLAQTAFLEFGAKQILVAQDAFMQEIYWGCYQIHSDQIIQEHDNDKPLNSSARTAKKFAQQYPLMQPMQADSLIDPWKVNFPADKPWLAVGDGWGVYADALTHRCETGYLTSVEVDCFPQAKALLLLAEREFQLGKVISAEQALPVYLRAHNAWKKTTDS